MADNFFTKLINGLKSYSTASNNNNSSSINDTYQSTANTSKGTAKNSGGEYAKSLEKVKADLLNNKIDSKTALSELKNTTNNLIFGQNSGNKETGLNANVYTSAGREETKAKEDAELKASSDKLRKQSASAMDKAVGDIAEWSKLDEGMSNVGKQWRTQWNQEDVENIRNQDDVIQVGDHQKENTAKKQADELVSNYGGYFHKDGTQATQEETSANNETYQQLKNVTDEVKLLNDNYEKGLVSNDDYMSQYQSLESQYNELNNKLADYDVKTGWDYYDAIKDNGSEEAEKLTEALAHYDDGILDRLGSELSATVNDFNNSIPQAIAVYNYNENGVVDSESNKVALKNQEYSDELRNYALGGTSGFEKMSIEVIGSIMPQMVATCAAVAATAATGGLAGATTFGAVVEAVSTPTTYIMGAQQGVNDAWQMMNEGYSAEECITHGVTIGAISSAVERIGADKFTEFFLGGAGQYVIGSKVNFLLQNIDYSAFVKSLGESAISEAIEEVAESVADGMANDIFNIENNTDLDGVMQINMADLGKEALYAGLGAFIMGGARGIETQVEVNIQNQENLKQAKNIVTELENNIAKCQTKEELDVYTKAHDAFANAIKNYESSSIYQDSVKELTEEGALPSVNSYEDAMNRIAEGYRYNIQQATEMKESVDKARAMMNSALANRGLELSTNSSGKSLADIYINADEQTKQNLLQVGQINQKLGSNVKVATPDVDPKLLNAKINGTTINGYFDEEGNTVVNVNSKESINSLIGHEITHALEGSNLYNDIVREIGDKANGILGNKLSSYEKIGADIKSEEIAEYIGKEIFNDKFIDKVVSYGDNLTYRIIRTIEALPSSASKTRLENAWMEAYSNRQITKEVDNIVYDLDKEGYKANGKSVAFKDDKLNSIIDKVKDDSFIEFGNFDNVYLTYMTPSEYLSLTLRDDLISYFNDELNQEWYNNGKLNDEKMSEYSFRPRQIDNIFLGVKNGRVVTQEGRHRMIILENAGYTKIPVLVYADNSLELQNDLNSMDRELNSDDFNPNNSFEANIGGWREAGNGYKSLDLELDNVKTEDKEYIISKYGSGANADIQYSLGGDIGLNNLKNYNEDLYNRIVKNREIANEMRSETNEDGSRKYTEEEIGEKTGWSIPKWATENGDAKDRFEFYDDGTIDKLANYIINNKGLATKFDDYATSKAQPTIGDIIGADESVLLTMYPQLRNLNLVVVNRASRKAGGYSSKWQRIKVNKKSSVNSGGYTYPVGEIKDSLAHEIQHLIQEVEGFKYKGNTNNYWNFAGERESFDVGGKQRYPENRIFDSFSDTMNSNEERNSVGTNQQSIQNNGNEVPTETGLEDNNGQLSNDSGVSVEENPTSVGSGNNTEENVDDLGSGNDVKIPGIETDANGNDVSTFAHPNEETENAQEKVASILAEIPEEPNESKENRIKRLWNLFRDQIGDKGSVIRDISREAKNPQLEATYDWSMNSTNMANNTLLNGRYDYDVENGKIVGKKVSESLADIQNDFDKLGDDKQTFYEYMYHLLNIDRMTLNDRYLKNGQLIESILNGLTAKEQAKVDAHLDDAEWLHDYAKTIAEDMGILADNKPVFGKSVTAEDSQAFVNDIESKHPEWKKLRNRVYSYVQADLDTAVKYGVRSEQQANALREMYPHYVPIVRNKQQLDREGNPDNSKSSNRLVKTATGGNSDIMPLDYAMAKYTQNAYRSATNNVLYSELGKTIDSNYRGAVEENNSDFLDDMVGDYMLNKGTDEEAPSIIYYVNGMKMQQTISQRLYDALSARQNPFGIEDSEILTGLSKIRRNSLTNWNPIFFITNGIKDIQDATYNTKNGASFIPAYLEAWNQIRTKGDMYNLYVANGGLYNGNYLTENGAVDIKSNNVIAKGLNAISSLNEAVEMAPRLAEFIASMNNGKTIQQSMFDAAEITVNFKRGGDTAKFLDRNGLTFFNASIQGTLKQIHNVQDAIDNGPKGILTYMAKLSILAGIPLVLLNKVVWKDDDDYDELSDYIKQNYYIIGKYGDGKFIRIPKGRIASFYQTIIDSGYKTITGESKLWDALVDDYTSFMDNVAPNNPVDNNLISPIIQAANNETWYGEDLVPTRLQDEPASEQYDESTDFFSKWLGQLSYKASQATGIKQLETSPYKINYLLDQYGGALSDLVLPVITPKASQDTNNPLLVPLMDKFTTDSVLKNQNVSDFYSLKEEMNTEVNRDGVSDEVVLSNKYINSISGTMSNLYAEKREIQNDDSLSKEEKYEKVREIQKEINDLATTAVGEYDQLDIDGNNAVVGGIAYTKSEDGWSKVSSDSMNYRYYELIGTDDSKALSTAQEITSIKSRIGSNGKTYSNSKALQVRKKLVELGLYDSVIESIKSGDTTPSNWGLSDTVVKYTETAFENAYLTMMSNSKVGESETDEKDYSTIIGEDNGETETSTSSSKKTASTKAVKTTASTSSKSTSTSSATSKNTDENEVTNNNLVSYLKAYANAMSGASKNTTTNGIKVCSNCGSKIPATDSICPVCGAPQ